MQSKYEAWEYWKVIPSSDNEGYLLKNAYTGKYISVEDKSTRNYGNIHQWQDDNTNDDNNTIRFEPLGDGFFVIRFRHSNRALAIQGSCSSIVRQTNVRQEEYRGWDDMKWEFIEKERSISTNSPFVKAQEILGDSKLSFQTGLSLSPNPSSSEMLISYSVKKEASVTIKIMDLNGRILFYAKQKARIGQENQFLWQGRGFQGKLLPKGIYLCRIEVGGDVYIKRIVRL